MVKLLGRFTPYYLGDRWRIALSLACGIASAVLVIAAVWPIRQLIDGVLLGTPADNTLATPLRSMPAHVAGLALAGLAGLLAIGSALTSALEKTLNARLREAMTMRLRVTLLDDVLSRPLNNFSGLRSGELVLRIIDDTGHVARLFCKTAPTILRYAATLLAALGTMFLVSWAMGLTGLVIVAVLAVMVTRSAGRLQSSSRAKRRTEGSVAGLTQEILRNLRFIRATGGESTTRALFASRNADALSTGVEETRESVRLEQRSQVANALAAFLVTAAGSWLVTRGQLSVGDLTLCLTCLTQLLKPVEKLNELTSTVTSALTRAERLAAFLPQATSKASSAKPVTARVGTGLLQLSGVSYGHSGQEPLLRDLNVTFNARESVWIRGASGAGKSTLIDLLLRLIEPTQGEIRLAGRPASAWPVAAWRSQFAVSLQTPYLFAGTLRDAVAFGNPPLDDAAIWRALDAAGLGDVVRELPEGLDHALSESGGNLSGGQRAKLSLARALAAQRPLLVLDEPLANLDPRSQAEVALALRALRGKRTVLLVSHQPVPAELFDRVLVLEGGRLHDVVQRELSQVAS
ncbi:MAG: ABC transporter ATP-binding protein [Proteobacteria bacterium]|nr:ABC transporter ATP-binding protein [Pseudomonadota bacterium]